MWEGSGYPNTHWKTLSWIFTTNHSLLYCFFSNSISLKHSVFENINDYKGFARMILHPARVLRGTLWHVFLILIILQFLWLRTVCNTLQLIKIYDEDVWRLICASKSKLLLWKVMSPPILFVVWAKHHNSNLFWKRQHFTKSQLKQS